MIKVQFKCQQCGECCRKYSRELAASAQDIVRWRKEKRSDILKHVLVFEAEGEVAGGELWLNPRTGEKVACPFLEKRGRKFHCSIHDTKPGVCRKYPFTGVNVRMECRGIMLLKS